MKYLSYIIVLLVLSTLLVSCGNNKEENIDNNDSSTVETNSLTAPDFNKDSAFAFVKAQTDFGPRVPGSTANKACAIYLKETMSRFADTSFIQTGKVRLYTGEIIDCRNIISVFDAEKTSRILLCAHWDSRPYADWDEDEANHRKPIDGADDGASGVGVLMEIARLISKNRPNVGIDIIFFDVEDYGEPQDAQGKGNENAWALGSQYWSKNPHKAGYFAKYGILLDMVGASDAVFSKEGFSTTYAPTIVEKIWNTAKKLGYEKYFVDKNGGYVTDDHYYINTIIGIPTVDIIHRNSDNKSGFGNHWHTMNDNIDIIDPNTLKAAGQTVLEVIYSE
jgi:Peptidase family M28